MSNRRQRRSALLVSALAVCLSWSVARIAPPAVAAELAGKKIVLLAGTVHQGPGGHPAGTHEYELTARLLKDAVEKAAPGVRAEVHFDGWPRDQRTLDDADTIVVISDGADRNATDHPLLVGDRLSVLQKQMDRGCGLVAIHWSVFVPNDRGGPEFLQWIGGYFDYQSGPAPRNWYSKIQTAATKPVPASPQHPISRGLAPFDLREEYYYNIRFRPDDPRLVPILTTSIPGEPDEQTVAWAVERDGDGRGFGFTGGHFFENWGLENFRRMVLNAILWTAHVEVPPGGAASQQPAVTMPEIAPDDAPISVVIVTGHQHPAHDWRATTAALQEALTVDRRVQVTVVTDPELLATQNLFGYDAVLLNYCNWQREGLSEAARANFVKYLEGGGGLSILHFTNGAFHASLPETPESDWPEFRSICRRVWDHAPGKSGHDPYGRFTVHVVQDHPITAGLNSFETIDELYFGQQGDAPIEVLATAHSTITGRDEPMAFVYSYGQGRVFQTVLGHAAESIRVPAAAELIRRGTIWAAGAPQRKVAVEDAQPKHGVPQLAQEGKFGAALDARPGAAWAKWREAYSQRPLTVECFARLDSKAGFNVLVASEPKESAEHWEIYSYAGSGHFSLYLPGYEPAEIVSDVEITDGTWHHVAAAFDDTQARLFVDGQLVQETPLERLRSGGPRGLLYFGGYPPGGIGCQGLVDEVRISSGLREPASSITAAFSPDESTIGLWHFDRIAAGTVEDVSSAANHAVSGHRLEAAPPLLTRRPSDPALRLQTIDTSPDESFLSLRTDTSGRLFAGGREALFAYEPDGYGGYGPRQLLYRFPPDTWITDVEIRGDDLYVMTNAALYRLAGGRVQCENLQPERLLWGSPVDLHVTWHGLAWGPEGDLYFASGDPLLNYGDFQNRPDHWGHWTIYSADGTRTPYTGVGGFFRCRPDGSNFQVVAGGARGAVGIAFDRRWNVFSNDNDHESIAHRYSPARLLHVAPQANFFWPRGWIAEMSPERSDLLDVVNRGMGREVPVGQAYCDEPVLGPEYADSLLVARWGQRLVSGYRLKQRGASFAGEEFPVLVGEDLARPVGVTVDSQGHILVALSYMAGNEWSPKYPSEIVMLSPASESISPASDFYEAPSASPQKLWAELNHPAWQRRQRAHVEILRRGDAMLSEASERLRQCQLGDPALVHLVWLTAAAGREAQASVREYASHESALLRATAIRALAEFGDPRASGDTVASALSDADPQVRHAAVAALFETDQPLPHELKGPASENDTYLRQASTLLLARRATWNQLDGLLQSSDATSRLAGVLASGFRLTVPPAVGELPAELPLKYESQNAEFTILYADAEVDLKSLGRIGSFTTAERWRHVSPSADEQRCYATLVERLDDADDRVYAQAAYFLTLLDDERSNGLVKKTRRARTLQRLQTAPRTQVTKAWTVGPFDDGADGFATVHPPERGAIDLAAALPAGEAMLHWQQDEVDPAKGFRLAGAAADASSYYYLRLQTLRPQAAAISVAAPGMITAWHNTRSIAGGVPLVVELAPGSNDLLLRVELGRSPAELTLAVQAAEPLEIALPEKVAPGSLAERLRTAGQPGAVDIPPEFLTVDWMEAAARGDAERGRKLFSADALGCAKCHAVLPDQAGGGAPSLAGAAKRFTAEHLVESILAPSKQLAPVFGTTTIVTAGGQTHSGLVVEEDDANVVLLLPTAARQVVAKSDIEARRLQNTSPMPSGLVKTPAELGDLLAYLLSPDPRAP